MSMVHSLVGDMKQNKSSDVFYHCNNYTHSWSVYTGSVGASSSNYTPLKSNKPRFILVSCFNLFLRVALEWRNKLLHTHLNASLKS